MEQFNAQGYSLCPFPCQNKHFPNRNLQNFTTLHKKKNHLPFSVSFSLALCAPCVRQHVNREAKRKPKRAMSGYRYPKHLHIHCSIKGIDCVA